MPAIQTAAAAAVRRGFDTYLSSHNLAPNTIHIYHLPWNSICTAIPN